MIKDQYREETNKDVYSDSSQGSYEDDYVRWLETKLQLLQPDVIKSVCSNKLDCPFDFTSRCTMGRCDCKPKQTVL